jgi:hypothetical protein
MADPDVLAGLGFNVNSLMQSPGGTAGGTGMVYLGATAKPKGGGSPQGPYAPGYTPKYQNKPGLLDYTGSNEVPYEQARNMPLSWSEKEKREFINKGILYKMPGFNPDMGMPEIMDQWDNLSQMSQAWGAKGQKWSPWDIMDSYKTDGKGYGTRKSADGDWLVDTATGDRVKYIGPKSKTTTDKRINLSSPEDVKALTSQMLAELLGRAPTAGELAQYRASINSAEKATPEIVKTTQNLNDMGEVISSESTTSGGVSEAARAGLISEETKGTDEYGKFQGGTTYMNALMQMLGG